MKKASVIKKWLHQLIQFWNENSWLGVLCIFYVSVIAFSVWVSPTSFGDPDAFYHMKITEIMIEQQAPVTDFTWLPYTTLADSYVDHHLMYHVFLVPFYLVLGTIMGMKVSTFLLAATAVTLFYIVLKKHTVQYAFAFAILLLFTEGFAFRMALSKAPSFSLLFLLGLFFLISRKQWVALIPLSFFYVWSYGGFALAIVLGGLFAGASLFHSIAKDGHIFVWEKWRTALTPLSVITIGILLGLLIHPSFPEHLNFYYQQLVQIGIVNYADTIGVGGEWYPMDPLDLFAGGAQITLLILAGIVAYISKFKKQDAYSTTAGLLTLLFCFMTLKSQRYIEYYIPFAYLFAALSLQYAGWLAAIPRSLASLRNILSTAMMKKVATVSMFLFAFFIGSIVIGFNGVRTLKSLRHGFTFDRYEAAGQWLAEHANEGDIIFHSDWDDFPILFFHAPNARFIAGLDPTFLYNADSELYWKWANITTGENSENLIHIIGRDFNARFVVIETDHTKMITNIKNDGNFTLSYEDEELLIFRVPRTLPEQTNSVAPQAPTAVE